MDFAQGIFLWAGFGFLGAVTMVLVVAAVSHGALLQGMLRDRSGGPAGLHRIVFAFGNIGLALVFLVRILEFDGSPEAAAGSIAALKELAALGAGDVELPALSGALSGFYLWGKMKS